jgi:hypothetical protein
MVNFKRVLKKWHKMPEKYKEKCNRLEWKGRTLYIYLVMQNIKNELKIAFKNIISEIFTHFKIIINFRHKNKIYK